MVKRGEKSYDEESIRVLEGIEGYRKRPAMYIGSTDAEGNYHLFREILSNSIDEFSNYPEGNIIEILVKDDRKTISIQDYGRGIPFGKSKQYGISTLEVIFTKTHAGGKFDSESYKYSGGLHGVGGTAVNALSTNFEVISVRDNKEGHFIFNEGVLVSENVKKSGVKYKSGTRVTYTPDPKIFSELGYDVERMKNDLRHYAYLNPGLRFTLTYRGVTDSFFSSLGIIEMYPSIGKLPAEELIKPALVKFFGDGFEAEVCFGYTYSSKEPFHSFVNNIFTKNGGTHVMGFKNALLFVLNSFQAKLKEGGIEKFTLEEISDGFKGIFNLKWQEPIFENQTKEKLVNPEARKKIYDVAKIELTKYFKKDKTSLQAILKRCVLSSKALRQQKKSREILRKSIKNVSLNMVLPGKLTDCTGTVETGTELFITEGNSAAGTAKDARDRIYQAILPIRGKILNTLKANDDQIVKSEEILNIMTALGVDIYNTDPTRLEKMRYEKVIIMADADSDGGHIFCLLMTFFYLYYPDLIEAGRVLKACPPLYRVTYDKKSEYIFKEQDLIEIQKEFPNAKIQRYKGLGVMNYDELAYTTMDPRTRNVLQMHISDKDKFVNTMNGLMGEDSSLRKEILTTDIMK